MTARIKIIACSEVHQLPVELPGVGKLVIPIDGNFHSVPKGLIPMLRDSAVEFELEDENAQEPEREDGTEAGGGDGLGGSEPPPSLTEGETPDPILPPDRDGNGEPGGSLPGNKTVPAAKGKRKTRKG